MSLPCECSVIGMQSSEILLCRLIVFFFHEHNGGSSGALRVVHDVVTEHVFYLLPESSSHLLLTVGKSATVRGTRMHYFAARAFVFPSLLQRRHRLQGAGSDCSPRCSRRKQNARTTYIRLVRRRRSTRSSAAFRTRILWALLRLYGAAGRETRLLCL